MEEPNEGMLNKWREEGKEGRRKGGNIYSGSDTKRLNKGTWIVMGVPASSAGHQITG